MTKSKSKWKLKSKRNFLETQDNSDSYYTLWVGKSNGFTRLKMADCHRSIEWEFGTPGDTRAKKKIAVLKKLVDEMYSHLHEEES